MEKRKIIDAPKGYRESPRYLMKFTEERAFVAELMQS